MIKKNVPDEDPLKHSDTGLLSLHADDMAGIIKQMQLKLPSEIIVTSE